MTSPEILVAALRDVATDEYGWPVDEENFDRYLHQFSEAEMAGIGMEPGDSQERFPRVSAGIGADSTLGQRYLFDPGPAAAPEPHGDPEVELTTLIRDAFLDVNEGASTDLVVADPRRNCRFVQACWGRGIQASQAELNHWLLNARKAKKIGKISGVVRYSVPHEVMEAYEFASEVAVRLLQDRIFQEEASWVSLDDILCEPKLGRRFHRIAESITPGFEELDYRWAALSIRKAMNRKVAKQTAIRRPDFVPLGTAENISRGAVPEVAGFFRIKCAGVDFYVGHARNLREKVEAVIAADLGAKVLSQASCLLFEPEPLEYFIAPAATMRVSHRFAVKKLVVTESSPRLNITKEMDRHAA